VGARKAAFRRTQHPASPTEEERPIASAAHDDEAGVVVAVAVWVEGCLRTQAEAPAAVQRLGQTA
jgi:hypothetical protein